MAVTWEKLEEYTGKRSQVQPDKDGNEVTVEVDVTDIKVKFTSDSPEIEHERYVNVCVDDQGNYDEDATDVRIAEVAAGVENKIAVGAIS
tara:strand:+ start:266 stop:535 length:270 start_codon:yes stop_codon:yes gene_type:complete